MKLNKKEIELINKIVNYDFPDYYDEEDEYEGYDELVGSLLRELNIWEIRTPHRNLEKYGKKDMWSIIAGYADISIGDRYFYGDTFLEVLLKICIKKAEINNE